ncbi:MAG: FAD-dependent oxidoreductase [Pseudonocardiaceae bacterium]
MSTHPVLVVGAGPTGLAVACGLRAHGVPIRVLDGAVGPAVTSRALRLQPRGAEVIDRLGALGDLPSRSLPVHQVMVHVGGRELARLGGRDADSSGAPSRLAGVAGRDRG